jgi:hypothetical protein
LIRFLHLCYQEVLCNSLKQSLQRCTKRSVARTQSIVLYEDQFIKVNSLPPCPFLSRLQTMNLSMKVLINRSSCRDINRSCGKPIPGYFASALSVMFWMITTTASRTSRSSADTENSIRVLKLPRVPIDRVSELCCK